MSKRILITSGPTRAPLDAVRFLSNRSTGRFGTLLAEEALRRGMRVTLVHGVGSLVPPKHHRLRLIEIETNRDLEMVLKRELTRGRHDAVIHAMAVLDFEPKQIRRGKVGSRKGDWSVRLRPTRKIIDRIKRWDPDIFLVGFKLEAGLKESEMVRRARRLLRESRADLVVANQLAEGADERHGGILLDKDGRVSKKIVGKKDISREIIRRCQKRTGSS